MPALSFIDSGRAGFRAVRALKRRRRLRDLPLPDLAAERTGLLLLARSPHRKDTRRSEWFVTKSPTVRIGARRSTTSSPSPAALLRSVASTDRARRRSIPAPNPGWRSSTRSSTSSITSIRRCGIRRIETRRRQRTRPNSHGPQFFGEVASMVTQYLATRAGPGRLRLPPRRLRRARPRNYGGIVGTTIPGFPSYPQRYTEGLGRAAGACGRWRSASNR